MAPRFLDTDALLRYFTRDDEEKAARVLALLTRVERGEERVETSPMIIFEVVFTLQKQYRVPREQIRDLLTPIIALRGLRLASKHVFLRALDLYVAHNLSFADAFNAAQMAARGIATIYTWDKDYDRVPGVERVEPTANEPV